MRYNLASCCILNEVYAACMVIVAVSRKQICDIRCSDPGIFYVFHYAVMSFTSTGIDKRRLAFTFNEIDGSV